MTTSHASDVQNNNPHAQQHTISMTCRPGSEDRAVAGRSGGGGDGVGASGRLLPTQPSPSPIRSPQQGAPRRAPVHPWPPACPPHLAMTKSSRTMRDPSPMYF